MKATVRKLSFPDGCRILAVSDVHGNLPYLRGLLKRVRFSHNDILVLVGDMMEKGPQSLDTLHYIMQLQQEYRVYPICGNCDGWNRFIDQPSDDMDTHIRDYILYGQGPWQHGLLYQMCEQLGIAITPETNMPALRAVLAQEFAEEFAFLRNLPTILETEYYTFVHGGLPEGRMEELNAFRCMKNDAFLQQGRQMEKWCIVGHWPVVLYGGDITCANPIIDRQSRIISIDGGCVLKDDGQLNALIIPENGSEAFTFDYYDSFPVRRVETMQEASKTSAYFRYGDNHVRVLQRGEEFSLCEHVRTGYRMEILTKYLRGDGTECTCNDCTDYALPLRPGDLVSVVEETGRGYLVKHHGISGWYYGTLR